MADRPTAYQLAADLWDRSGIPSFPVLLAQDEDGKWLKKPLVKWGGVTRDTHPSEFNWGGANAVGVPMGRRSGLFAFDLDEYKPQSAASEWVKKHGLPPTRTHGTTSGGRHLIYQMPPSLSLGNSAPKVHGLDVRGDGGFIVWTDTLGRYSVVDDRAPAALPQLVGEAVYLLREFKRKGRNWWELSGEERSKLAEHRQQAEVADPWMGIIAAVIDGLDEVCAGQLMDEHVRIKQRDGTEKFTNKRGIGKPIQSRTPHDGRRIASILQKLGWVPDGRMPHGSPWPRTMRYVPGDHRHE